MRAGKAGQLLCWPHLAYQDLWWDGSWTQYCLVALANSGATAWHFQNWQVLYPFATNKGPRWKINTNKQLHSLCSLQLLLPDYFCFSCCSLITSICVLILDMETSSLPRVSLFAGALVGGVSCECKVILCINYLWSHELLHESHKSVATTCNERGVFADLALTVYIVLSILCTVSLADWE